VIKRAPAQHPGQVKAAEAPPDRADPVPAPSPTVLASEN
jgi:hypothetical protein